MFQKKNPEETFREVVGGLINLSGVLSETPDLSQAPAPASAPNMGMGMGMPLDPNMGMPVDPNMGMGMNPAHMDPALSRMLFQRQQQQQPPVNIAGGSTNSTPEEVGQGMPPVQY